MDVVLVNRFWISPSRFPSLVIMLPKYTNLSIIFNGVSPRIMGINPADCDGWCSVGFFFTDCQSPPCAGIIQVINNFLQFLHLNTGECGIIYIKEVSDDISQRLASP